MKQRRRCIADGDQRAVEPVGPKVERGRRTGGAEPFGQCRHARIIKRADHFIFGRQETADDAMRHHLGVAENRRPARERGARCGDEVRIKLELARGLHQAAGMDHADHDRGLVR